LNSVIQRLITTTFRAQTASPYEAEIARATQRVLIDHLMRLAADAPMAQVRAIASYRLQQQLTALSAAPGASPEAAAHATLVAADIKRFIERPSSPAQRGELPEAPPGAPIGDPAMDWLRRPDGRCEFAWQ
jgi:hypothetical protein